MGLQRFAKYQELLRTGHCTPRMGFTGKAGDINIFSNRVRLAKAFQGIQLDSYSEPTTTGYNGFMRVFLVHSALECFLKLMYGKNQLDELNIVVPKYDADSVMQEFCTRDSKGLLYNFLHERVNPKLQTKLHDIREGRCSNTAYISASIRHIFAHGELTANANKINPKQVGKICFVLSDHLLAVMDGEFTRKIDEYCTTKGLSVHSVEKTHQAV